MTKTEQLLQEDCDLYTVRRAKGIKLEWVITNWQILVIDRARDWTVEALRSAGIRHHCDGGNYLLVWPQKPVAELDAALRGEGILIRSMAGKALIDGCFRVSIGTTSQMQRFMEAFLRLDQ